MPAEMQDFDVRTHGAYLENGRDKKEKYRKGGGPLPLAETGFLQGVVGGRVGKEVGGRGRSRFFILIMVVVWFSENVSL